MLLSFGARVGNLLFTYITSSFHCIKAHIARIRLDSMVSRNIMSKRSASGFAKWYRELWKNEIIEPTPPYSHVCQIGDPILRLKAGPVSPEAIKTKEIQQVISSMKKAMKIYNAVGLSAPQIGIPYRIVLIEFSKENLEKFSQEIRKAREMEVCPQKVLINPSIEIRNHKKVIFSEGCESVKGYSASVARFREVYVNGLNEKAEPVNWTAKGWLARIAQHEIDHLDGKFYTDIMDAKSFQCDHWYAVNVCEGQHQIRFK